MRTVDAMPIGRWSSRIALNADLGKEWWLGWGCWMKLGDWVSNMLRGVVWRGAVCTMCNAAAGAVAAAVVACPQPPKRRKASPVTRQMRHSGISVAPMRS